MNFIKIFKHISRLSEEHESSKASNQGQASEGTQEPTGGIYTPLQILLESERKRVREQSPKFRYLEGQSAQGRSRPTLSVLRGGAAQVRKRNSGI
jgi:hypothetical protein